ncbi:hypothetical protein A3750_12680 [Oleiphilus sp. HI0079]|uniref:BatD family protein n=2 Tax=Oleiphilus sp. HI0079 TaxID=1822254 RepID=UPI0007C34E92|nr:BatD family protein [Oleiphilus sp. HI0079]KZZ14984.1 hypothetical protein A3750_12680 [Oleiphilus sp. HI0079]KZZ78995.1 hypothetical protein A3767_11895 [Oleiphilus sp. HI0133]
MVNRVPFLSLRANLLALLFLLGNALSASAATELNLSVDKNKLYQNEILNLTVQVNSELDFSLGGLMNFGGAQVESPSFEGIEQDWEIIDKQQSYNMQSINGKTQSLITWRYALSPKRSGVLQVPQATFQDSTSSPINIDVIAGNRPRDESNPPPVFLKASIDKPSPYLQEQIIYTLELYTLGEARGDMSEPTHPDLIIEPLGETSKTYKMRFNQRYEVYERRYLLFPQKSGPLTISAQEFSGTVVDARTRRRGRARELSNEVALQVRQPPSTFSGETWLPATSLFINETYDPDITEIKQGDSITRKISISALGLLGSALPELPAPSISGMKIYPDQAQVNASEHAQGVQSSRLETQAMVAISPGEYTLPAIKLKWWDTVNDRERTATVPERVITILPDEYASHSQQNTEKNAPPLEMNDVLPESDNGTLGNTPIITPITEDDHGAVTAESASGTLWIYATLTALTLWAMHAAYLYRRLSRQPAPTAPHELHSGTEAEAQLSTLSDRLTDAVKSNDHSLAVKARHWFELLSELAPTISQDIEAEFRQLVRLFEAAHFAKEAQELDKETKNRLTKLVVDTTRNAEQRTKRNPSNKGLAPFYPA